jgi:hypothetical protein
MNYDPWELVFIQCKNCGYTSDDLEEFVKNKNKPAGREQECKVCCANRVKLIGQVTKKIIDAACNKPCFRCGNRYPAYVMDFHHLDPNMKDLSVSGMKTYRIDRVLSEIDKCIVVCANCHRVIHNEVGHEKQGSS